MIDVAEALITVVKCLDVFGEKVQFIFAYMWTFHFGERWVDIFSKRSGE